MGLFDELLKKPPQPANDGSGGSTGQASGGSTGQGDNTSPVIKIEKTTEQSIMTDSIGSAPVAPIEVPTPVIQNVSPIVVDTDASGILVNGEAVTIPAPMPVAEVPAPMPETPIVMQDPVSVVEAPISIEAQAAPTPVVGNVDLGNLFGDSSVTTEAEVAALVSTPEEESAEETTAIITESDDSTSSLLGEEKTQTEEFMHLEDYIRSNINQTEALIGKINASHEAKLEEAAGYKSEKERFADLEQTAYTDAEKMVAERLHAEKMKTYFEKQLEEEDSSEKQVEVVAPVEAKTEEKKEIPKAQDELFYDEPPMEEDVTLIDDTGINGSVETALTGLAVQNTVNKTMEKKHKIKKQEEKKEETFSLV